MGICKASKKLETVDVDSNLKEPSNEVHKILGAFLTGLAPDLQDAKNEDFEGFYRTVQESLSTLKRGEERVRTFEVLHHLMIHSRIAATMFLKYMANHSHFRERIVELAKFALQDNAWGDRVKLDTKIQSFLKKLIETVSNFRFDLSGRGVMSVFENRLMG